MIRANHAYRFGHFSIRFFEMDYVGLPARPMCTMCTMRVYDMYNKILRVFAPSS